ncbi:MAG TPA: M35 family metallo-endopeptidase [Candidatus Limnocylindrales bacterium]|nr:M35 family metallo-endopeptidase [Candidatus Limnocylindrales bacterium]
MSQVGHETRIGRGTGEPAARTAEVQAPDELEALLSLQRAVGNAAFGQLLNGGGISYPASGARPVPRWPRARISFSTPTLQRAGDFEIVGRVSEPGQTDTIFFNRGDSVIPASEAPKIAASIAAFGAGTRLFLDGYASEDEPAGTATARTAAVRAALAGETPPHTGPVTERDQSALGSGRIDYRNMRKVEIQPPAPAPSGGTRAPRPSAPARRTRPCGAALRNCKPRARSMLTTAIAALATPNAATQTHLSTFFGSGGVAAAATIRTHLTNLKGHIDNNVKGSKVRCHTELDADCVNPAYNQRTGSAARMTLCPAFLDNPGNIDENAATLIHEAAHGTSGLATVDLAYGHTRLIHTLSTADALTNSDSYVLLVRNLVADAAGAAGPAGGVSGDTISGLNAAETQAARFALAHAEKWLTASYQDVAGAYSVVHDTIGAGSWTGTAVAFSRDTVHRLAPLFGLTDPGASAPFTLPVAADREKLAAIHDRFLAMRSVMWSTGVAISAGTPSKWAAGPGSSVELSAAFFALPDDLARIRRLIGLLAAAHPDISAARRPSYVTAADQIRQQRGLGP